MKEYSPDNWQIIKIKAPDHPQHFRVIAGWYGGYTQGDSWKISSGVEGIVDKGTYWEMAQTSGSVYKCHKECERSSMNTHSIFTMYRNLYADKFKEQPWVFEIVPIQEVIDYYAT